MDVDSKKTESIEKEKIKVEERKSSNSREDQRKGLLIDVLGKLGEKTILDEAKLASILGVTSRTVRRMVSRFEIPPPISLGGRSVWFVGRLLAHIDAAAERAEREAARHAKKIYKITT
ncbi:MAG: hypothetical protein KAT43_06170 [Nanoarchaeota archaeon]|nr:hypothetical protein [Nanoarchaeota archaeon]